MTSSAGLLEMHTLNVRRGAAANFTASALSTLRCSSGMAYPAVFAGLFFQVREKSVDFAPHFRPAGKPPPMSTDQTDQFVALVDGNQVILVEMRTASCADTIHKQRDDVGLHAPEHGIDLYDVFPGVERQQGFDGARRTWIKSNHSVSRAAVEEESHFDWNAQAVPLRTG